MENRKGTKGRKGERKARTEEGIGKKTKEGMDEENGRKAG